MLFLQWIPWVLRMSRPGDKITLKSILMQNKMKELDTKVSSGELKLELEFELECVLS